MQLTVMWASNSLEMVVATPHILSCGHCPCTEFPLMFHQNISVLCAVYTCCTTPSFSRNSRSSVSPVAPTPGLSKQSAMPFSEPARLRVQRASLKPRVGPFPVVLSASTFYPPNKHGSAQASFGRLRSFWKGVLCTSMLVGGMATTAAFQLSLYPTV